MTPLSYPRLDPYLSEFSACIAADVVLCFNLLNILIILVVTFRALPAAATALEDGAPAALSSTDLAAGGDLSDNIGCPFAVLEVLFCKFFGTYVKLLQKVFHIIALFYRTEHT